MRTFLLLTIVALLLAAVVGVGWYFSNTILVPQPYGLMPEFQIISAEPGSVTLPLPVSDSLYAATLKEGRYALLWNGGHGVLGNVLSQDDTSVTRELSVTEGTLPTAGEDARMDIFIYRRDPQQDLGLEYETLTLQGEAGRLNAWYLPGDPETAVLMLHGRRRGDIQETLRILPTLHDMGYTVLSLNYRNHGASDLSPDGFYHYGATEWRDAQVALGFLRDQGVERVVLYGFSMGGAVALETVERNLEGLPAVEALVLDSPLVDPREVFKKGARDMGLPFADTLTELALSVARLRASIDWRGLDQRLNANDVEVPVLLIAGTNDDTITIDVMDEFATKLPEVDYRRLNGVGHVEGWNQNPEAYERWVRTFLEEKAPL